MKARGRAAWRAAIMATTVVVRAVTLLPIALVLSIVAMDWATFVCMFMARRFDENPFAVVLFDTAFTICAFLTTLSYLRCVFTSNSISRNPPPPHFDDEDCQRCLKCSGLKPSRTHHCSMCGECSMKMDHHCPWIANCVGHYNYKYFLLFLFWAFMGCIVYLAGVGSDIPSVFKIGPRDGFAMDIMALFAILTSIAFSISLMFFLGFHLHLVLINQTTLEYGFIRRGDNLYDQGRRKNFESVFGTQKRYWLLPVNTLISSGWDYHQGLEESIPMSTVDRYNSSVDEMA